MKKSQIILALLASFIAASGTVAQATSLAPPGVVTAPTAPVPMIQLKGFYGAAYYEATLDTNGKLSIKDTNADRVVYTKTLKAMTFSQIAGYSYLLGERSLEIVTQHAEIVCMMMPFEASQLSVAVRDGLGHSTSEVRTVLDLNGCAHPTSIFPKEDYALTQAEILKGAMLLLVNESGIIERLNRR